MKPPFSSKHTSFLFDEDEKEDEQLQQYFIPRKCLDVETRPLLPRSSYIIIMMIIIGIVHNYIV